MTEDPNKKIQQSGADLYLFSADRLYYLQIKEPTVLKYHGMAAPTKPVISEDDLQRFLQKYKRSNFLETLQEMYPEKEANSPVSLPKTNLEPNSKKLSALLLTILAILSKFRPESLIRQTASKDTHIVRPPGSTLSSVAEFFLSPKTMERVVTPIISDLQLEYFEALAARRKIKARWVRLRGYWSLFKALGLYSILKLFLETWRKLSSG